MQLVSQCFRMSYASLSDSVSIIQNKNNVNVDLKYALRINISTIVANVCLNYHFLNFPYLFIMLHFGKKQEFTIIGNCTGNPDYSGYLWVLIRTVRQSFQEYRSLFAAGGG